jgi:hypothetical protein
MLFTLKMGTIVESRKFFLMLVACLCMALPAHAQPGGGPGGGDPGDPPRDTPELDPSVLVGLTTAGYFGYQAAKAGAFRKEQ